MFCSCLQRKVIHVFMCHCLAVSWLAQLRVIQCNVIQLNVFIVTSQHLIKINLILLWNQMKQWNWLQFLTASVLHHPKYWKKNQYRYIDISWWLVEPFGTHTGNLRSRYFFCSDIRFARSRRQSDMLRWSTGIKCRHSNTCCISCNSSSCSRNATSNAYCQVYCSLWYAYHLDANSYSTLIRPREYRTNAQRLILKYSLFEISGRCLTLGCVFHSELCFRAEDTFWRIFSFLHTFTIITVTHGAGCIHLIMFFFPFRWDGSTTKWPR